ncbi:hypothetical protein FSP39_013652 [Pinctada imbricata]|uniref:DNA repair protein RAD51 homolog 2 n=1 Tax=Pinctada imbricata TaxID=66713 RepID=A0AA88XVM4_PINIB|nr:hypothetical protein FSP39_013652 [Pinctada imbricata]
MRLSSFFYIHNVNKLSSSMIKDVISKSELELLKYLGTGIYTVRDVVQKCCEACIPECITSFELLEKRKQRGGSFFPTSLKDLDQVLHGGLPFGTITEVAGPSGCGKTQFCVMLSVQATLPTTEGGMGGAVLYIDTESAFSPERLMEVAKEKHPHLFMSQESLVTVGQRVLVDVQQTCAGLIKRLENLEEEIISHKVKLIVVDSIASLVRKEYTNCGGNRLAERTNFLSRQAALLKNLAEVFNIPVVVTNQITTRIGHKKTIEFEEDNPPELTSDSGYVTAALGNTWSHNINTRLILQYLDGHVRQVMVAKSPVSPFTSFNYVIENKGIVQLEQTGGHYAGTDPGSQNIRVRSSLPISLAGT